MFVNETILVTSRMLILMNIKKVLINISQEIIGLIYIIFCLQLVTDTLKKQQNSIKEMVR